MELDAIDGKPILHWASEKGYWGIVDLFIGNDIVDVNQLDNYGKSALQWACGAGIFYIAS